MKAFMDKEFMLQSPTAQHLYHAYAEDMPICDYHCHIPPREIYENRRFDNIAQVWLGGRNPDGSYFGDHYKWRVMRSNGVPEEYITGDKPDRERFQKFAEALPMAIGNPMYHWTNLELHTFFGYDGVLISPGPGAPAESGASEDMIRLCAATGVPMFGVCLGLQALAEVYGCTVDHAPTIMHGKTSLVEHIDDEIFEGVANPMTATRYHSLAVEPDSVPDTLQVTAWTQDDHIIQGVRVKDKPMYAVQFHPESVMTQDGYRLLANWLKVCGQDNAVAKSAGLQPKVTK